MQTTKLSIAAELWAEAIDAADHELAEYGHYMNDSSDDRRIAEAAVRAALDTLKIAIEMHERPPTATCG